MIHVWCLLSFGSVTWLQIDPNKKNHLFVLGLVWTHHGDAVNFNSYFIFVSDHHYMHIFHILLMVICLFTDIIS